MNVFCLDKVTGHYLAQNGGGMNDAFPGKVHLNDLGVHLPELPQRGALFKRQGYERSM